jgi:exopolyphosphatase/guanosine-5'-triphosphate,3'-diphosphate pyrophosphatase
MLDALQGAANVSSPNQHEDIDRFTEACGVDMAHARHVAKLAGEIYAGLCELYDLPGGDRRLLEAAARMQDVGYLISYEGHHKHSYHLILHSRLQAFLPEELEIIANVARYHRGAEPKNKHDNFGSLDEKDQQRVCQMAAVLRVAGGLDRSHNQTVRAVRVAGGAGMVELSLQSDEYPEVDIWACRRRADMFEEVFDAELTVKWEGAPASGPASVNGAAKAAAPSERGAISK